MKKICLKLTLVAATLLMATATFAAGDAVLCPQINISTLQYDQKDSMTNMQAFTTPDKNSVVIVNGASNQTAAEVLLAKVVGPYSTDATELPIYPVIMSLYVCTYAPYSKSYSTVTPGIIWAKLVMNEKEKASNHLSTLELIKQIH